MKLLQKNIISGIAIIFLVPLFFILSCKKDNNDEGTPPPPPPPPGAPSNPLPANNAIDQALMQTLTWTCIDPNQDPLTYDVHFGSINPPPLVQSALTTTAYNAGQLLESTTYYWQIIAYDDGGLSTQGAVWKFTTQTGSTFQCGDVLTDPRDGEDYNTVLIGLQCWMSENIRIGNMINGTQEQMDNGTIEKYCFNNVLTNCDTYGGLYQWNEMMQYVTNEGSQGICPSGWHLPSDPEWMELELEIGMPLSEVTSSGLRGTNEGAILKVGGSSGFNALLAGYRNNGGNFLSLNIYGTFSTSTQSNPTLAWTRYLFNSHNQILREKYGKTFGYSVRCIKD